MKQHLSLLLLFLGAATPLCAQQMDDVAEHSKYMKAVDEYKPAPGQFINLLPQYQAGDTEATMVQKCTESIKKGDMVCLGGYGGYITFHFDHSIANVSGKSDVLIKGNCTYDGNSEPGIVMVSKDVNHNGLPDDPWYELKGSADVDSVGKVVYDYTISYSRPTSEEEEPEPSSVSPYITREKYIPWTDNQGGSGYVCKISYHTQTYYPQWVEADQITFENRTLLPPNAHNTGNYQHEKWVREALRWGYVDNRTTANDENGSFDFDNAVEVVSRQPVALDFVDFIRVYTGVNQFCGWIGETSTEIVGAEDLHLDESIQRISDALAGIHVVSGDDQTVSASFTLDGRPCTAGHRGMQIIRLNNGTTKKLFIK